MPPLEKSGPSLGPSASARDLTQKLTPGRTRIPSVNSLQPLDGGRGGSFMRWGGGDDGSEPIQWNSLSVISLLTLSALLILVLGVMRLESMQLSRAENTMAALMNRVLLLENELDNGYTLIEMSSHMNGKNAATTQEACANEQQSLMMAMEKMEGKVKAHAALLSEERKSQQAKLANLKGVIASMESKISELRKEKRLLVQKLGDTF